MDALGERLRAEGVPAEEDLDLLGRLLAQYEAPTSRLRDDVTELLPPGFELSGRIKSRRSILWKLRRFKTLRLSQMQDLSGLRVSKRGGIGNLDTVKLRAFLIREPAVPAQDLATQDRLVELISGLFEAPKIDDRRLNPLHGYRAVHVIGTVDGCWIEVQVRTPLQHRWAELMEKMSDRHGRGIRYGEVPPTNPEGSLEQSNLLHSLRVMGQYSRALALLEQGDLGSATLVCDAEEAILKSL